MGRKFRIGDKVKVVGMSPVTFAPNVKDELGTEKPFKSMLGKVYTVRRFDKYANVELEPKRGVKGGERVEQIVFCQIAEEPQRRMDLCGLAEFSQVFRYTWPG